MKRLTLCIFNSSLWLQREYTTTKYVALILEILSTQYIFRNNDFVPYKHGFFYDENR